ncbi:MAG: acetyl-CoA decarbonylase/synthase complex subunit gamma [Desulfobacterota bacterium]|nr:acetyl-CoA decarbonylase/synthase complex subunit gamma [Thermodesulfobacteriota bacterium]
MALTGMDIFKLLPKTNCQDCGVATCLAFAMKLAAGQTELDACPHLTKEVREQLEEASAPAVRQIVIGTNENALKIGGETVQFRHERTFVNKPALGVVVTDTMPENKIDAIMTRFRTLRYERVGQILKPDIVAIRQVTGDTDRYLKIVRKIIEARIGALVLMSKNIESLAAAAAATASMRPLLYAAEADNLEDMHRLAITYSCPLVVKGNGIDATASLVGRLLAMKFKDIVIDTSPSSFAQAFYDNVAVRRAAVVAKNRTVGFPTIVLPCDMADDPIQETLFAATFIAKYGGIILLSDLQGERLFPLLVQRMNIYTDPQRPMTTSEGIYEINSPDATSPVVITSNFSLTYFIVSSEIETSRVPTWLLIKDTEGLSVLTAWAAGKFSADSIAPFVRRCGIEKKIDRKRLIIPGCVANISGELEEELKDWEIHIGPREASALVPYLKNWI